MKEAEKHNIVYYVTSVLERNIKGQWSQFLLCQDVLYYLAGYSCDWW